MNWISRNENCSMKVYLAEKLNRHLKTVLMSSVSLLKKKKKDAHNKGHSQCSAFTSPMQLPSAGRPSSVTSLCAQALPPHRQGHSHHLLLGGGHNLITGTRGKAAVSRPIALLVLLPPVFSLPSFTKLSQVKCKITLIWRAIGTQHNCLHEKQKQ